MKPAIRVENLSKSYRIGAAPTGEYRTLRESLMDVAATPWRRLQDLSRWGTVGEEPSNDHFWALKDISFEVHPGEVVGIIGRNGAGKSTLLKILSRITEPTSGRAEFRGRLASLLEVGTGFHAELTGRENIYLNGSILGMPRQEIARHFDEIVAFSEIEKFLDTPVKRYSSGMYVRLAFAVAAHLDPEILIVDEVLAVGDVGFQKKCLSKMGQFAREGRTILIVSHQMTAIRTLCERAIVLRRGEAVFQGDVESAVKNYLGYLHETAEDAFGNNPERSGSGKIRLNGAHLLNESGEQTTNLIAGRSATLVLTYENPERVNRVNVVMTVFNQLGVAVTNLNTVMAGADLGHLASEGEIRCTLPRLPLPIGHYRIAIALQIGNENADLIPNAVVFDVQASDFFPTGRTPDIKYCSCLVDHQWHHEATVGC